MARLPIIDDQVLYRMLVEEHRSQVDCARFFGVSEAAVSKRVRTLNIQLSRHTQLERAAEVHSHGLDVMRQLESINQAITTELNWALEEARQPGADRKSLQRVIGDHAGEIRKQLHSQLEIMKSLYDLHAIADFQKGVMDVIGECAPEVRQEIIARLQHRRSLQSAVRLPGADS